MPSSASIVSSVDVENQGNSLGLVNKLNFVGDGVDVSIENGKAMVDITGLAGVVGAGYNLKNVVRYGSPGIGTYIKPDDIDALLITAVGGGAGGSGSGAPFAQFASATTNGALGTCLLLDSDGNLYWAVCNNRTSGFNLVSYVYKITPQGNITTFASANTNGAHDTALSWGPDGNLYWAITNYYNGSTYNLTSYVYKITPGGTRTTFASVSTSGATGTALAWDSDGNLYWAVCNSNNGSTKNLNSYIYKITSEGVLSTLTLAATNGAQRTALIMGQDNNLYWAISNYHNGSTYGLTSYVYKVPLWGSIEVFSSVATAGAFGTDLLFGPDGNLYWAINNHYNGSTYNLTSYVYKITSGGSLSVFASMLATAASAVALVFDSNANLYWTLTEYSSGTYYYRSCNVYKVSSNSSISAYHYISAYGPNGVDLIMDSNNVLYLAVSNHYNGSTFANLTSYVYKSMVLPHGGQGGGAGGCAIKFISSPSSSYDYVIGAGGASGAAGGNTSIAGMTAYGGSSNVGGSAVGGDVNIKGGGSSGLRSFHGGGESGGDSYFGCGGHGGNDTIANGGSGSLGGGGGGAAKGSSVGGSGGAGVIEIREYVKSGKHKNERIMRGFKNIIINGDMRISQRGTNFIIGQTSSAYTLDRWKQENNHNASNIIVSQDSDITPNIKVPYSLKVVNANGSSSSIGPEQYLIISQKIEGHNVLPFVGKNLSLSFWVRSSKVGTYCVSLRNAGYDRSYIHEFSISKANVWKKKTFIFPMNYVGGTWNYADGVGLILTICLAGGSSYQAPDKAWQSGNYFCTANQVNWLNEINNSFYLTNVQLEDGIAVTQFERRFLADELRLCQRYYQQLGGNQYDLCYMIASTSTGGQFGTTYVLPIPMRATPTATKVGTWTVFNCDQPSATSTSPSTFELYSNNVSGHEHYGWYCSGQNDMIILDAEL